MNGGGGGKIRFQILAKMAKWRLLTMLKSQDFG
jgi:hypothetical protein